MGSLRSPKHSLEHLISAHIDNMDEEIPLSGEKSAGLTPEQLGIELGLMAGVAVLCIVLFAIYIALAKKPQNVSAEYFMKNRLPLLKKVQEVKKEVKRQKRAAEEEVFVLLSSKYLTADEKYF